MSETHVLKGKTALVTGASSGLGADFARHLAGHGCNLILVARREELMQALKSELTGQYGVQVEVMAADLTAPDAPQALYDRITGAGKQVDVLVNNAGFGLHGEFKDIPWEKERNMLELDILVPVHLAKLFLKDMLARNFGHILMVASIGAYQPSPTYASYSAAKSFLLYFTEAISYELRRSKVRCTVVSPGVTRTEFLKVSGQQATLYQRIMMMDSAKVTRIGLDAMLRGKPSVVPGTLNAILAWFTRFMPRRLSAALAYRTMTIG